MLEEFRSLPIADRRPELPDPSQAKPPERPVPELPPGGLAIRGFCTYLEHGKSLQHGKSLEHGKDQKLSRARRFYYEQNPDRWEVETQSDMLWLTEAEWRSMIPAMPGIGDVAEVSPEIRERFFGTIGIDYMEGSVNALATRDSTMTLRVDTVDERSVSLRLDGYARLGKAMLAELRSQPRSRGCEVRVVGHLEYDRTARKLTRVDIVGVGAAWGNKMDYVRREIAIAPYPWLYGIACELVTGDAPKDRVPPYNLLHYGSGRPYFPTTSR